MTASPYLETVPTAIRCPKCTAEMARYERAGVHVDQCRECRGIFLDRGELERLIDMEARDVRPERTTPAYGEVRRPEGGRSGGPGYRAEWHDDDDDRRSDDDRRWGVAPRKSKKRSLLGELLEGFGD